MFTVYWYIKYVGHVDTGVHWTQIFTFLESVRKLRSHLLWAYIKWHNNLSNNYKSEKQIFFYTITLIYYMRKNLRAIYNNA